MINIITSYKWYDNIIILLKILFLNFSIKFEKYLSEIDNMIYFEKIIKSDNNDLSFIASTHSAHLFNLHLLILWKLYGIEF